MRPNSTSEILSQLQILLDQSKSNKMDTVVECVTHDSFEFVIKQAMLMLALQRELIKELDPSKVVDYD